MGTWKVGCSIRAKLILAYAFCLIQAFATNSQLCRESGDESACGTVNLIFRSTIGCPSPAIHDSGKSLNLRSSIGMRTRELLAPHHALLVRLSLSRHLLTALEAFGQLT